MKEAAEVDAGVKRLSGSRFQGNLPVAAIPFSTLLLSSAMPLFATTSFVFTSRLFESRIERTWTLPTPYSPTEALFKLVVKQLHISVLSYALDQL